jgi:TIR domain
MAAHDIFICYSSKDEAKARTILDYIEANGFKCWISSRDVRPGRNYQESIVEAIQSARILMFLFSEFSNTTGEVKKELSLASSFDIPVIPLRLTPTTPNAALQYELSTRQWIDAFPRLEAALDRAIAAIHETLLTGGTAHEPSATKVKPRKPKPKAQAGKAEASRPPIVASGSEEFEAIRTLLAHHVGPIAKILMQKAAADAQSIEEFCEQLASHVSPAAERAKFLHAARQRLSAGA